MLFLRKGLFRFLGIMTENVQTAPCSIAAKRKLDDSTKEAVSGLDTSKKHCPEAQSTSASTEIAEPFVRKPKARKYAMLLSYSGLGYYGMQINGDTPTIEKDLFRALMELDMIESSHPSTFRFQRAARTDKGVSAVRQMCSLLLRVSDEDLQTLPDQLNEKLPSKIKVMGFKRATKSFDSKKDCSARTYSYTLPTYAFTHCDEITDESFRMYETRLNEVNDILKIYRGTHNYFNFTSGKEHKEMSCNRYITDCRCEPPFMAENLEFVTILIKGQSFMLHQIRKMIGLCIAIIRGMTDKSTIQKAWESKRVDIPKAPGLGLALEKVHYDSYDVKFGKDRELLDSWEEQEEMVKRHKEDFIIPTIYDGESKGRSMFEWLKTLPLHYFEAVYDNDGTEIQGPLADACNLLTGDDQPEETNTNEAEDKSEPKESKEQTEVKETTQ